MPLSNRQISELLARRADETEDQRRRAYLRAARAALMWPEEAADLVERDEPLTELYGIGVRLAGRIEAWLEDPPEVPEPEATRTGFLTLAEARSELERDPGWRSLNGDLQMHTVYSDGKATVFEMASKAIELGYEYIAITDHSKGLKIAGGVDEHEFARQGREIEDVNKRFEKEGIDFRILPAMEMNLDGEGAGDMEEEVFGLLDLVLGSFHSQLRTKDDQTDRYLGALRNPHVDVVGHPRGRKFNRRLGLQADWDVVLEEAAATQTALEINSYPDRQDLNVEILKLAGPDNLFSIGTDAHSTDEMMLIEFALAAASMAGLDRERIVNFWPSEKLVAWAAANAG